MKFQLRELTENPLHPEEEEALRPLLEELKKSSDKKITIQFEGEETPTLARKKVSYLAARLSVPIRFKTKAGILHVLSGKARAKRTRTTKLEVEAQIIAHLQRQPDFNANKNDLIGGTGLTYRQVSRALKSLIESNRILHEGEGVYRWKND